MTEQTRYLTYMFCDLVGSTRITRERDPESAFELIHGFQRSCAALVEEHAGFVARYMGDSLLTYFGYPVASDASTEAAVRCALKISSAVQELGPGLQVRIGIANGRGVLAELQMGDGSAEMAVVSDATNLAARLEAEAAPGEILVSSQVHDQVQGLFDFSPARAVQLKGYDEPQQSYSVLGFGRFESTSHQRGEQGEFVCIGRESEIGHAMALWQEVRATGNGRSMLVQGPAGIGKTSIAREIGQRLGASSVQLRLYSSQFEKHTAFYPFKSFFEGLWPVGGDAAFRRWLSHMLGTAENAAHEKTVGLLLGRRQAPEMAPNLLRERILQGLVELLLSLGGGRALMIAIEDLHWLDATSVELLVRLQQSAARGAVFLLATARQDTAVTAAIHWDLQQELRRLDADSLKSLLRIVDDHGALSPELQQRILDKAGGVPLLAREFARAAISAVESGKDADLVIPDDLLQSFLAQIDTWAPRRDIVDVAAAIGHGFSTELIARTLGMPEDDVAQVLKELTAHDLLIAYLTPRGTAYNFSHALLGDAAYSTLLRKQRRQIHQQILDACMALEEAFEDRQPIQAAHHLQGIEDYARAIEVLLKGARLRFAESHFAESSGLADQAVALLPQLEDDSERYALALQLHTLQGLALTQVRGFSDSSVNEAYSKAWKICAELKESGANEFTAIWGIWAHKLVVSETREGIELINRLADIATRINDADLRLLVAAGRVVISFCTGDFPAVDESLPQVLEAYDQERHARLALSYSQDPRTISLLFNAHCCMARGDVARAAGARSEAIQHASNLGMDFLIPYTNIFGHASAVYYGADERLVGQFDKHIAMAVELGLPFWVLSGSLWKGAALTQMRRYEEAAAILESGLQQADATGLSLMVCYLRGMYGAALSGLARHDEALSVFEHSVRAATQSGEVCTLAEVYRLQAQALLAAERRQEACQALERGLELSIRQAALGWESRLLQTATELALEEALPQDALDSFRQRVQAAGLAEQPHMRSLLQRQ